MKKRCEENHQECVSVFSPYSPQIEKSQYANSLDFLWSPVLLDVGPQAAKIKQLDSCCMLVYFQIRPCGFIFCHCYYLFPFCGLVGVYCFGRLNTYCVGLTKESWLGLNV